MVWSKIRRRKWKAKMVKDAKRLKIALTKLNDWVVKHYGKDSRFTKVDLQGDLFQDLILTHSVL